MTESRVTVLMTVYNGERFLRQAIDSILAQTMRDFRFLIIDNASTDTTRDIIALSLKRICAKAKRTADMSAGCIRCATFTARAERARQKLTLLRLSSAARLASRARAKGLSLATGSGPTVAPSRSARHRRERCIETNNLAEVAHPEKV